ncbi:thioesterase II family protein [Pseudomonas sp. RHF3.3-3]|uniref:Putative thioesterase involved in non-ribosomal peptide biosynthesis n=1 Tax=Pseudomonas asplenii TaxID=53407 RepID=A0A0M9GG35_9PSED|nr:alpha/beta fold hydrolase [Pseudomonas fuscovaginae]KPA90330.1 putative thioesterase involved in non-ribosomal peptide biosynthesis [Pseudomonas fuscovaginae]
MSNDSIQLLSKGSDERVRLLCFPHAGAGASIYHVWSNHLPSWVGVHGVQLPGREQRVHEAALMDWQPLVEQICQGVAEWDDTPFIFYGHSLGGLLAYEVARSLQLRGATGPRVLVTGGAYAPSAVRKDKTRFTNQAELIESIRRLGGVDEAVIQDKDFIQHFMPMIAADFTLFNRYVHDADATPLACPVVALFGRYDENHDRENALQWRAHTSGNLHVREVAGGHFFHRECVGETLDIVKRFASAGAW